jgi:CMP-N,N'-diacetyllegionaminic acid synthase
MTFREHKIMAVVPARGGSKGIPRKNLRQVAGVSLVARAGQLANSLDWIDARVLSTDDEDIAREGRANGLDVPFMRPDELAGDLSTSVDMWRHAWLSAEAHYSTRFDASILLEPTSPLRTAEDVTATVAALIDGGHKAAATVSPAPAHFTPHKCLTVTDGKIGFYHAEGAGHSLRQTIPNYYFRNGICYALRRRTLIDEGHILGDDCVAVIVERPVVNIDEPFDLELATFLLQREM